MGFFQDIAPMIPDKGSINMAIAKREDGTLMVTMLPKFPDLPRDNDKAVVKPTLLRGTTAELDEQFTGLMQTELEARKSLYDSVRNTIETIENEKKKKQEPRENKTKNKLASPADSRLEPPAHHAEPADKPEGAPETQDGFSFSLPGDSPSKAENTENKED